MTVAGGKKQLPDGAVIAICFAIPPAFIATMAYAPFILLWLLIGVVWIGVSAWLIGIWFLVRK